MRCIGSDESEDEQEGLTLGRVWEAIGPFPSGMREHPLTCTPLHAFGDLSIDKDIEFTYRKYDDETWPTEFGRASWERFDGDGWVEVSYPKVDWAQLRQDHGWASTQYQVLLRTSLKVPISKTKKTGIRIDAKQLTEYAFIKRGSRECPIWYQGDLYNFADSSSGQRGGSNFSRPLALAPGEYIVLARALYEIRLFGGDLPPVIRFKLDIALSDGVEVVGKIVPDLVGGVFMGDYIALGVRVAATLPGIIVEKVVVKGLRVSMEETAIASGQTRMVAIRLEGETRLSKLDLEITYRQGTSRVIHHSLPLRHVSNRPFRITFSNAGQIGYAIVIPPDDMSRAETTPVILALHGAGVDVEWETWIDAIPKTGWAVLPTGKNEWGEDWHGASMSDAWAARDALTQVVAKLGSTCSEKTLLIGHSNGGQGAWHVASHYPDRVIGVVAAAGYMKIQDYVPYTELTGHHYADPALMGILLSSLAPYNNDLHLSNLVHIPCLALHGGSDSNVPPRHSRLYGSIISSWQHEKAVEVVEVEGKDHWWDGMFGHPRVTAFIQEVFRRERTWEEDRRLGYTLTCVTPEECGGRGGIRIVELDTPGRIARLDVKLDQRLELRGMNVKRIEIAGVEMMRKQDGSFKVETSGVARAHGPMIRILANGPIYFVTDNHLDLATRLAHDTFVHHRVDSVILRAEDALRLAAEGKLRGNVVTIGRPEENRFTEWLLQSSEVSFPAKGIEVSGRTVYETGAGIISLLPHPTNSQKLSLLIAGNDAQGMETAARLFPIRTGVPVPDWVVVGPRMSWQAAGGIIGAGFWDGAWGYSERMSWFDRERHAPH